MRGVLMFLSNNNIAAAAAQLFRETGDKTYGGGEVVVLSGAANPVSQRWQLLSMGVSNYQFYQNLVSAIPSAAPGRGSDSCLRFLGRFVSVSAARGQKLRQTGGFLLLIIAELSWELGAAG